MLELEHIHKTFTNAGRTLTVLDDLTVTIDTGATYAIVGPSGSGKTTLLGLCAGLDRPTTGTVRFEGALLNDMDEEALAALRRQHVGFIFQTFRLMPSLTALENVMIPAELLGMEQPAARAMELLEHVGLTERAKHYPSQLSGGEQQRVAIARAFINEPRIIFADEPTGNLDDDTGAHVLDLLFSLNRDQGTTLVLVTHDHELTSRVQHLLTIKRGQLTQRRATG